MAAVIGGFHGRDARARMDVGYADRVERAVVLAVSAAASAEQIASVRSKSARLGPIPAFAG